ncbi:hypothetical protein HPP92_027863 [Vanilla planifolia]|uniref:Uncharacterized protein n=1 Tax=Vanilla planifolia TaxID=51239 RepID=A0A835PB94_VANPL|nr:hypothetical protein HPP92_027863 [Vanilla planifolia]
MIRAAIRVLITEIVGGAPCGNGNMYIAGGWGNPSWEKWPRSEAVHHHHPLLLQLLRLRLLLLLLLLSLLPRTAADAGLPAAIMSGFSAGMPLPGRQGPILPPRSCRREASRWKIGCAAAGVPDQVVRLPAASSLHPPLGVVRRHCVAFFSPSHDHLCRVHTPPFPFFAYLLLLRPLICTGMSIGSPPTPPPPPPPPFFHVSNDGSLTTVPTVFFSRHDGTPLKALGGACRTRRDSGSPRNRRQAIKSSRSS